MKRIETNCEIDVEFFDLDPMNVVWHGNYVKYLEKARCDMLSKIGYTYDDMKSDNSAYPIVKMDMKYIKPATFMQKLNIKTVIEEVEPALIIKYFVTDNKTGEKIFQAKSMQMRIDIKTMETMYTAPKRFLQKIEEYKG